MPAIRVLIAADVRLDREGLAGLLERDERFTVAGQAADREETVGATARLHPQALLIDMRMAEAPETVQALRASHPTLRIVAIALAETDEAIVAAAEAGVSGFVLRSASYEDLAATVESLERGELRCSPRTAAVLLRRVAKLAAHRELKLPAPDLTHRELEVLQLIERGMSNKEIARTLRIEVATAKNHVHNILDKLHVHRRGEAAARMRQHLD